MINKAFITALFITIFACSYSQVSKINSTIGTITSVPTNGTHLDRTFIFIAEEFSTTALTEVELSLKLIIGNGAPPTPGTYGVHEDLNVRLVSPSGTIVDLVQDRWGYWTGDPTQPHSFNGFTAVDATVSFDDDHTVNIMSVNDWTMGDFAPQNPLSTFDGENAAGTWTLRISDGNGQFAPNDYIHFVTATLTVTSGSTLSTTEVVNTMKAIKIITSSEEMEVVYDSSLVLENYTVYNMTGAIVAVGIENSINTSSLTSGIYILKLHFNRGTIFKKFIKQ